MNIISVGGKYEKWIEVVDMKVNMLEVYEYAYTKLKYLYYNKKNKITEIGKIMHDKYGYPESFVIDIANNNIDQAQFTSNPLSLYAIIDSLHTYYKAYKSVEEIYTEQEINSFKNQKYIVETVGDIVLDAIQVTLDQWVTAVDVEWFMKMRRSSKIRYNVATQRPMTRRSINGGMEIYEITISKPAIKGIREMYHNQSYIPNDIVLNIDPTLDDVIIKYDKEKKQLIIKNLDHFDIIDGYNRYRALCEEKDLNPEFQQVFCLQIMNFTVDKALRYIYQQDLKIKMRKADAESMNRDDFANQIVDQLNTNSYSPWKGMISRNQAQIDYSDLSTIIRSLWITPTFKRVDMFKTANNIAEELNKLTQQKPDLMTGKLDARELLMIMFYIKHYTGEDAEPCDNDIFTVLNMVKEKGVDLIEKVFASYSNERIVILKKTLQTVERCFKN